jgi:hypothetical protein
VLDRERERERRKEREKRKKKEKDKGEKTSKRGKSVCKTCQPSSNHSLILTACRKKAGLIWAGGARDNTFHTNPNGTDYTLKEPIDEDRFPSR